LFETLKEAKVIVEDHRLDYNHRLALSCWTTFAITNAAMMTSSKRVLSRIRFIATAPD
jgi:hypothetical protein